MSTYREERRRDAAAAAEQRRLDLAAAEARRAERQRAADERAARLRAQERKEKERERADRQRRREERAARRAQSLTPANVYRRGTLALVAASAAAALPAQVLHFVHISWMLLPLPLAIEGAAWVMAAGVAFADERHLPGWTRWLLRGLVLACASFAAAINWQYGRHLPGLSETDAVVAGAGLAAVSVLGPVVFEIRQWVSTITAATGSEEDRARRRHAKRRRKHHGDVAQVADRLLSAAPYGALTDEDAWRRAWAIVHGTTEPGMTPALHQAAVRSATALAAASRLSDETVQDRIIAGLRPINQALPGSVDVVDWALPGGTNVVPLLPASSQVATQMPPSPKRGADKVTKGTSKGAAKSRPVPPKRRPGDTPRYSIAARWAAAETARLHAVNGSAGGAR